MAWRRRLQPVGELSLKTTEPISRGFGLNRGTPIDRRYIDRFLAAHAADIKGDVLEIGDDSYSHRFGNPANLRRHVLHIEPGHLGATLIGDLATGSGISSSSYDCILLTQTLSFVYDTKGVLRTLSRALRTNGVVLATSGGISQISRYDMDRWGDFWRFTSRSLRDLFVETFGEERVTVHSYGNVLAAVALLHGLAAEELSASLLDAFDPDYEVLIGVRAVKSHDE